MLRFRGCEVPFAERRTRRSDDTGVLPPTHDHARDDHGLFRPSNRAIRCLRQLFSTHTTRCRRQSVSALQHDVLLGYLDGLLRPDHRIFRERWPTARRMDLVRPAERHREGGRSGTRHRSSNLGDRSCYLLCRPVAGSVELHLHGPGHALQGNDLESFAVYRLGMVHHFLHGPDRVCGVNAGSRPLNSGPRCRNQLLCPVWLGNQRPADTAFRWIHPALATLILVLRASRGIHRHRSRHGDRQVMF